MEAIKLLLQYKADWKLKSIHNKDAYDIAKEKNWKDVIEELKWEKTYSNPSHPLIYIPPINYNGTSKEGVQTIQELERQINWLSNALHFQIKENEERNALHLQIKENEELQRDYEKQLYNAREKIGEMTCELEDIKHKLKDMESKVQIEQLKDQSKEFDVEEVKT